MTNYLILGVAVLAIALIFYLMMSKKEKNSSSNSSSDNRPENPVM